MDDHSAQFRASKQNNAALFRKLNKSASFSTAATVEDWSCDGSATVQSKVSASSRASVPRRRSTMTMSVVASGKAVASGLNDDAAAVVVSNRDDVPSLAAEDGKNNSFTLDDGNAWWGNSPAKQSIKAAKVATPRGPLQDFFVPNDCPISDLDSSDIASPSKRKDYEDSGDFVDPDDNEWWKTSPTKQMKRDCVTNEVFDRFPKSSNFLVELDDDENQPSTFGPISPSTPSKRKDDSFGPSSNIATWSMDSPSKALNHDFVSSDDTTLQSPHAAPSLKPEQYGYGEDDQLAELEATSPSKRSDRKKKTIKRISVTKVKASGLSATQFVNEKGEALTDQVQMQEAIKLWNAEQKKKMSSGTRRASACVTGSPRKESTRGRRSSLTGGQGDGGDGTNKLRSSSRTRSKSKSRSATNEEPPADTRVRSKSKSRPPASDGPPEDIRVRSRSVSRPDKDTEGHRVRSLSRARSSDGSKECRVRSTSKPRPADDEKPDERRRGRSKSSARRKSVVEGRAASKSRFENSSSSLDLQGGDEHTLTPSMSESRSVGTRGRSAPRRKSEIDGGEKKRGSSLARGLTKISNDSNLGDCIGHMEEKSLNSLTDSVSKISIAERSMSSLHSGDESAGGRRRSTSLARALKKNPKDLQEEQRERLDGSRSVLSEETSSSRRRSKSVGVGLREPNCTAATALVRKRTSVARNNSSNITKRRTSCNRREDEFMKFAQMSLDSNDGFFAQLEEIEKEDRESESKSTPDNAFLAAGHKSSPSFNY